MPEDAKEAVGRGLRAKTVGSEPSTSSLWTGAYRCTVPVKPSGRRQLSPRPKRAHQPGESLPRPSLRCFRRPMTFRYASARCEPRSLCKSSRPTKSPRFGRLKPIDAMRSEALAPEPRRANGKRGETPSGMACAQKPSSTLSRISWTTERSRRPSLRITTPGPRWSASWCSGWHRRCGACVAPPRSRPICFGSRPNLRLHRVSTRFVFC